MVNRNFWDIEERVNKAHELIKVFGNLIMTIRASWVGRRQNLAPKSMVMSKLLAFCLSRAIVMLWFDLYRTSGLTLVLRALGRLLPAVLFIAGVPDVHRPPTVFRLWCFISRLL